MALGDGIRRNIANVSQLERDRFRDAIIALNSRFYPGAKTDFPAGGVSHWFKQDEIHQATHVHGVPAFLPWHRELCNRFEALLREVDPDLSLHYWEWNTDPAPLFTNTFMGSANGDAGEPWLSAGFYVPNPVGDAYRDDLWLLSCLPVPRKKVDDFVCGMIRQPGQHVGEPGLRITILLVEQLASYALAIADYGFVVANGRIAREGPSPVLSRDPEVMEAFLGKKKSAISTKA